MPVQIKPSTFEEVLLIWEKHLWPGRSSPIRAQSSILLNGDTDMSLYNNHVYFYKAVVENSVVGVNSVFETAKHEFRSRGLFVFPEFRRQMIGQLLLEEAIRYAKARDGKTIWSIPRVQVLPTYLKVGFEESHPADDSTMEFGPNVYVIKKI